MTNKDNLLLIVLQVWDTGGQERYRPVLTTCYRNAHGIIIVYDVTNEKSFANLNQWMTEVAEFAKPDLPKMLVIKLVIRQSKINVFMEGLR